MSATMSRSLDTREQYVRCRTIGHAWFDVPSEWSSDFGMPLTVRCERCGMERRDAISQATGELVTRHYTQPPGYKYTKDDPAPARSQFRLMLLALRSREDRAATRAASKKAAG
jgi:hypothetical protein